MKLREFLSEKRAAIREKWFDSILASYPADTSNFLKSHKDKFTNPVGSAIAGAVDGILGELIEGGRLPAEAGAAPGYLDDIIRIRAVQGFTASEAVSFVLALKKIIRAEVGGGKEAGGLLGEMPGLEDRIDALALLSFDIYMRCREKVYDLKANELRQRTFRLLQRAGLQEVPEEPVSPENNNKERGR